MKVSAYMAIISSRYMVFWTRFYVCFYVECMVFTGEYVEWVSVIRLSERKKVGVFWFIISGTILHKHNKGLMKLYIYEY